MEKQSSSEITSSGEATNVGTPTISLSTQKALERIKKYPTMPFDILENLKEYRQLLIRNDHTLPKIVTLRNTPQKLFTLCIEQNESIMTVVNTIIKTYSDWLSNIYFAGDSTEKKELEESWIKPALRPGGFIIPWIHSEIIYLTLKEYLHRNENDVPPTIQSFVQAILSDFFDMVNELKVFFIEEFKFEELKAAKEALLFATTTLWNNRSCLKAFFKINSRGNTSYTETVIINLYKELKNFFK